MTIVADRYDLVVGVDTHAASHTFAILAAGTGALLQTARFPTSTAGLNRALSWRQRHIGDRTVLLVVEGTGSYGAVLTDRLTTSGFTVAEAPRVHSGSRRGVGKSDGLDAAAIAHSVRGVPADQLRWPRAAGPRLAIRVLSVARDQMSAERTRAINALTALLRTVDLGVDARKRLTAAQVTAITAWRTRQEDPVTATCPAEAIRLARRIRDLDTDLTANHQALHAAVKAQAPQLLELPGVGAVVAATVLLAWSHPGRVRSEAAFAALAGASPVPASSGNTQRHRLNRGGDRRLNKALFTIVLVRTGHHDDTRAYVTRRTTEGSTKKEIIRCLKRYAARQLFRNLAATHPAPAAT